jgi:hypothetical protein
MQPRQGSGRRTRRSTFTDPKATRVDARTRLAVDAIANCRERQQAPGRAALNRVLAPLVRASRYSTAGADHITPGQGVASTRVTLSQARPSQ